MSGYRLLFDRVLTRIDPERAHQAAFAAIRTAEPILSRIPGGTHPGEPAATVMGLDFPGVLGLAAGFDKNGVGIDALAGLGFGFVEIGTVTGEPQPGNPRPRLFRLPADRAIVNRMGFNNEGAEAVSRRLADRAGRQAGMGPRGHRSVPLGINIGKTKVVPEEDQAAVIADYEKSTRLLAPYADYLVVNVSSPNTPGLRDLQSTVRLRPLLDAVRTAADRVGRPVPLLVKIAPDLSDDDVVDVAGLARETGLDGIIATNTTIAREGLTVSESEVARIGAGGLSGRPLRDRALEVIRLLRAQVGDELALIGVGGIGTVEDARRRLEAGADLVQAYTGFVYEGAGWPRQVNRELSATGAKAGGR